MIKNIYLLFFLFSINFIFSQTVELSGLVKASADVENIHVINKTANKFATTNAAGEFYIQAKLLDTVVFSSVQYKLKALVISADDIKQKVLLVTLEDYVNTLNEVVVGKVLTGDLESDLENSNVKAPINFYDVGIPGYKGKPLTKREREYKDASNGKIFSYYGIGFGINFYKLLNVISGRTKRLKNYVKLEKRDEILYKMIAEYSTIIFEEDELKDYQKKDFFFFCSDDIRFDEISTSGNDLLILEFLQEKYKVYKANLNQSKD